MARTPRKPTVEESIMTLISSYTKSRDWFMVERMFNDLGVLFVSQEKTV